VLQFASPSFDASVSEIAMALVAGASLHLAPRDQLIDPRRLARLCREWAITVATLPPSLLAALDPRDFPRLEALIVAGEVCPPAVAARWLAGRRLFNACRPTSGARWATSRSTSSTARCASPLRASRASCSSAARASRAGTPTGPS